MKGGPEYRLPLKIVFLGDTAVTSYRFVVKMNGPALTCIAGTERR